MTLVHALRSLRRAPLFATTVVLTLALGLAAIGTMAAVVHGVLLAPLPYGEPQRLVSLQLEDAEGSHIAHSPAIQTTYQQFATQLESVALHRTGSANVWSGRDDQGAEHLTASWITDSLLPLLQAQPLLGRSFSADEARRGGADAVILSESEWRSRFAAAPDVLGRTLIVNDVPREIVGVMPARFAFPDARTRLWLPVKRSDEALAGEFFYTALARLTPAATPASAQRELSVVLPRMAERFPRLQSGGSTAAWLGEVGLTPRAVPLGESLTARIAATLWMLAAVAALVMLVSWANVANLLLIRSGARSQDVAIRQALGASPQQAAAQRTAESVLLGAASATLALLASQIALLVLRAFGPADLPRLGELSLGPWSIGLVVVLALLGTPLAGALLTRFGAAASLTHRLHDGARGHTSSASRQRLRTTIAVLQVAAALVVVAGAGLLWRTADRLHAVHPGFDADQVTTFRILLPFARYRDTSRVAFFAALTERVAQLPGVQGAGLVARLPLGEGHLSDQNFVQDAAQRAQTLSVNVAGNGYFAAMRIPLLAGQEFAALDSQRPDEMIISQRAARLLFADAAHASAVGRTLRLDPGGPTYRIIGVAGDVHHADLATPPAAVVYRPQVVASQPEQDPGPLPAMSLVVRSTAPGQALVAAVRDSVRALDPSIPVFQVSSLREVVETSMSRLTLLLWLLGAAAVVSLLLGMIGLYGVMAYLVALRTREFGLRLALGAAPGRIARSVLGRGLTLTATGVSAGLLLFALAAPLLRASIVGIPSWDPASLIGSSAVLLITAALACWIPARRAAAVAPADALRAE